MNYLLFLDGVKDFFSTDLVQMVLGVLSIIPKLVYFLVACLLSIVDLFQVAFRKLAGLDPIMIGGDVTKGDTVYEILMDALFNNNGSYSAINTIFWSLIILGVFMLVMVSIFATLRLEYNPDKEKGNSKSKIIGNFIKALFSFAIIPIVTIFGMYVANSLIDVLDKATVASLSDNDEQYQYFDPWNEYDESVQNSELLAGVDSSYIAYNIFGISIPTTQEPFSGTVFKASAYSCNRFRKYGNAYLKQVKDSGNDLGLFKDNKINESADAATIIDTAFAINAQMKDGVDKNLYSGEINKDYYNPGIFSFFGSKNDAMFSKYNVEFVWFFYDLWTFNYIVAFVGLIVLGKLYAHFIMMLFGRIFEVLALFMFVPVPISLMPLDNGASMGRWRTHFLSKYSLILFTVFSLNMIAPVITIMQTIKFFGEPVLDYIILTAAIVAAMSAIDSIISTFAALLYEKVGTDNYTNSSKLASNASGNLMSGFNATKNAAGIIGGGAALIGKAGVGAVVGATRLGVNLGRSINDRRINNEERQVIRDSLLNTRTAGDHSEYLGMDKYGREEAFDQWQKTQSGQQFINDGIASGKFSSLSDARKKYVDDERKQGAVTLSRKLGDDEREEFAKFLHDRSMFDKTTNTARGDKGSDEYLKELEKYRDAGIEDKVKMHMGGKALDARQQSIQEKRERVHQDRTWSREGTKRKAFKDGVAGAIGVAKRGIAKVGDFSNKNLKPINKKIKDTIRILPGSSFIFKQDK